MTRKKTKIGLMAILAVMMLVLSACSNVVGTVYRSNQSLANNQSTATIGNLTVQDNENVENEYVSARTNAKYLNGSNINGTKGRITTFNSTTGTITVLSGTKASYSNLTASKNVRSLNITATGGVKTPYVIANTSKLVANVPLGAIYVYFNSSNKTGLCYKNISNGVAVKVQGVCSG